MTRLLTLTILIILIFGAANIFANEFCSDKPVDDKSIEGIWKGSDSYSVKIRVNKQKKLCISVVEENSVISRFVRDIVIVDGKLRHFSYYTPSTDGYVIYSNIKVSAKEMRFDWYSTFDNQSGSDVYYKHVK